MTYVLRIVLYRAVTKPLEIIKHRRFGSAENVSTTASSPGSSMYPVCGALTLLTAKEHLPSQQFIFSRLRKKKYKGEGMLVYLVGEIKNCVYTRDFG